MLRLCAWGCSPTVKHFLHEEVQHQGGQILNGNETISKITDSKIIKKNRTIELK